MAEVGRFVARAYGAERGSRPRRRRASRHRQAAGTRLRRRRRQLHARRQPRRPHRLGLMMVREACNGISGFPDRAALADRAPDRLAPRRPRIRLAGRAEDDRSVHPRVDRRARCEIESGAKSDCRRSVRRRVHVVEQALGKSPLQGKPDRPDPDHFRPSSGPSSPESPATTPPQS